MSNQPLNTPRILYCHCAYANVVPPEVKNQVLDALSASGVAFDAVPDLCEMSARRDPALQELAKGEMKIAACYPRAVTWLFNAANAPLPENGIQILNMRVESAENVTSALLASETDTIETEAIETDRAEAAATL